MSAAGTTAAELRRQNADRIVADIGAAPDKDGLNFEAALALASVAAMAEHTPDEVLVELVVRAAAAYNERWDALVAERLAWLADRTAIEQALKEAGDD